MSAELHMLPETTPMSWEVFIRDYDPYSIALDGFVKAGPEFEDSGPYLNANHHEGVNREATLSTAQQILMLARLGLEKSFTDSAGEFTANVYANDCDQDVCAAWYLLDNIEQAMQPSQALNRFIQVAGVLDVTAGAFPYDKNMRILGELNWVFKPYTMFRASGSMARKDPDEYRSIVDDVGLRIQAHLLGRGDRIKPDTCYRVIGGGKDWKMIKEVGPDGRSGAISDGVHAYVSVQQIDTGRWRYTVGRRSQLIPFDVPGILARLNEVETPEDGEWSGSNIIGGSPRAKDSRLDPAFVETVINEFTN